MSFDTSHPGGLIIHVKTPDGTIKYGPIVAGGHTEFWGGQYTGIYERNEETTLRKFSAKKTKRSSIAQENEVMEALGGRRHPGSGALVGLKGDGRVRDKYRVEMKQTRQKTYRVDRTELSKIRGECNFPEAPLFVIEFADPRTGGNPDRWVMVPFETFLQMDQDAAHLDTRPPAT